MNCFGLKPYSFGLGLKGVQRHHGVILVMVNKLTNLGILSLNPEPQTLIVPCFPRLWVLRVMQDFLVSTELRSRFERYRLH